MDCTELGDAASELALGMLDGEHRAAAIAHLEHCRPCQREVASLTDTVDLMLALAPPAEPPAGFETQVLARLAADAHHVPPALQPQPREARQREQDTAWHVRRRRDRDRPQDPAERHVRRLMTIAAAGVAAAVILLLFVGGRGGGVDTAAAAMRTQQGDAVGRAFVHYGDEPIVIVDVPGWPRLAQTYGAPAEGRYWLEVERADGRTSRIPLSAASTKLWRVPIAEDGSDVASVAVVDADGRVLCSAQFDP